MLKKAVESREDPVPALKQAEPLLAVERLNYVVGRRRAADHPAGHLADRARARVRLHRRRVGLRQDHTAGG
jgi:hypothetical protein